jgi:glycosyltransferase involved in cell wall biosynthesis
MQHLYFVEPKNPNLKHCSDSFIEAMNIKFPHESMNIERLKRIDIYTSKNLIEKIIATKKSSDTSSIFFFSTQPEYIVMMATIRCLNLLLRRNIKVYHLMHEPKYEKDRVSLKTSLLLYYSNWMISRLADRIILCSQQALIKGKSFIRPEKIVNINLVFASNNHNMLAKNLVDLKQSWDKLKTISLIGIAAKDKNPEGFLSLASVANMEHPNRARLIRAGWEKDVKIDYEKEKIIQFSNYITNGAKAFLLSLTHIIVIPYNFSTQSGVIIEAMSYGKIVIVNDIPSFSQFKRLKFVFAIDFNSKDQISDCLNKIFSMSGDEYEECCLAAIEYFEQNHSQLYLVDKLKSLMD